MSKFTKRAQHFRRMYATGENAQVLREVRPANGAIADVSMDGDTRRVVHFGSNNYLGFAKHPYVIEAAMKALREYGLSLCGSPMLNGATAEHRRLEERLAALKGTEDAILFPSGYSANVAWTQSLVSSLDHVIFDEYAHTSFQDGIRHLSKEKLRKFSHNSIPPTFETDASSNTFMFIEGVYSMHGDVPQLDKYVEFCRRIGATLVVDDAHGTGTLGTNGRGIFEAFGLRPNEAILVGTLSKGLGGTGGFICADSDTVTCLRASGNPAIFSASLAPPVVAGVHASMDLLEKEPERVARLQANVKFAASLLTELGAPVLQLSPIISLDIPRRVNVQRMVRALHYKGFYVNGVSYPAVARHEQRLRVSMSAEHDQSQINALAASIFEYLHSATKDAV